MLSNESNGMNLLPQACINTKNQHCKITYKAWQPHKIELKLRTKTKQNNLIFKKMHESTNCTLYIIINIDI